MTFGFVYLWFDRKHKRFYVGSHRGSIDDGYIASSAHVYRAYLKRKDDFKRKILWSGDVDRKTLYEHEQRYLNMIQDHELNSKYYNLKKLAVGRDGPPWNKGLKGVQVAWNKGLPGIVTSGFTGHTHTAESRERISKNSTKNVATLNKTSVSCPHCCKTGQFANMKRWHFENCKTA